MQPRYRRVVLMVLSVCALVLTTLGPSEAHEGHAGPHARAPAVVAQGALSSVAGSPEEASSPTSGQGRWVFRLRQDLSVLPEDAGPFLRGAHGGFAVNWRGSREVYFALKGCGIIRISPDLQKKDVVEVDPYVRAGNFHNTTLIYNEKGEPFLALPDNERQRVYVTTTRGELLQVLSHPRSNDYYTSGGAFVPTDVEQVPGGQVCIVTGYSRGDYVVSADPFSGSWRDLVFGGKGTEHGKFGTGHGITWNKVRSTIDIADRPHSRIESFSTDGKYQGTTALPAGSLPCDVDFLGDDHTVVGCLKGPGGSTPAPIYIVDAEGKVESTVKPKAELGLENFTHLHNVVWHAIGDGDERRIFLICQAWNPGDFAVLERVAGEG